MPFGPVVAPALLAVALGNRRVPRTLLQSILGGRSDATIRLADHRALMQHLGFEERIRGSQPIYRKEGMAEKVNLGRDGGNAKRYQVRLVRRLILKCDLGGDD